jgi:hypothetical protein
MIAEFVRMRRSGEVPASELRLRLPHPNRADHGRKQAQPHWDRSDLVF